MSVKLVTLTPTWARKEKLALLRPGDQVEGIRGEKTGARIKF